ncbi:MAG: hypothetical protein R3D34_04795 [Nitratireductor sp.]
MGFITFIFAAINADRFREGRVVRGFGRLRTLCVPPNIRNLQARRNRCLFPRLKRGIWLAAGGETNLPDTALACVKNPLLWMVPLLRFQHLAGTAPARPAARLLLDPASLGLERKLSDWQPAWRNENSYTYEDLLACGRSELFGPGNAQLPAPPMLMFDRITDISAGWRIWARAISVPN